MLVSNFITRVNYVLRAIDDDAPTTGTEEYTYWLDTLNRKKDELYRDIKRWKNTYQVLNLGTITASAAPAYTIDSEFLEPANNVYVIDTEGHRHDFEIIHSEEVNPNKQQVFVAGTPSKLYFTQEIESTDNIFGGTLYMPGYFMPDDVDSDGDTVPLPDPNWGVMAVASEIAFGDLTYEDRAPDLNAKANALYGMMTKNNRRGTYNNPRVSPTNVRRITSPDR